MHTPAALSWICAEGVCGFGMSLNERNRTLSEANRSCQCDAPPGSGSIFNGFACFATEIAEITEKTFGFWLRALGELGGYSKLTKPLPAAFFLGFQPIVDCPPSTRRKQATAIRR